MRPGRPRLGFAGLGWVGLNRLRAVVRTEVAEVVAFCDPDPEACARARACVPKAAQAPDFSTLLEADLDAVVIATPTALHGVQALEAIESGRAVFCQKPLGRTAPEVDAVVDLAQMADVALGCDLPYRWARAFQLVHRRVHDGAIGRPFALDLVFHSAYGPDRAWCYEREKAGGGCLMDLGVHLVDLALWLLDFPKLDGLDCRLLRNGRPVGPDEVEDYAEAQLRFSGGPVARVACSWKLQAGRDAVIEASVYGTEGGLAARNVAGSQHDFVAEAFKGPLTQPLAGTPDAWAGRALVTWCRALTESMRFQPEARQLIAVARVLDGLYARAAR